MASMRRSPATAVEQTVVVAELVLQCHKYPSTPLGLLTAFSVHSAPVKSAQALTRVTSRALLAKLSQYGINSRVQRNSAHAESTQCTVGPDTDQAFVRSSREKLATKGMSSMNTPAHKTTWRSAFSVLAVSGKHAVGSRPQRCRIFLQSGSQGFLPGHSGQRY